MAGGGAGGQPVEGAARTELVRSDAGSIGGMPVKGTARSARVGGVALGLASAMVGGCLPSEKPGFDEPNPLRRMDAIVLASDKDADPETLARLVEQLDSQDPAARMLAIRALEKRTGQTLGYIHTDPEWKRQEAVDRWMNYLETGIDKTDLVAPSGDSGAADPMES